MTHGLLSDDTCARRTDAVLGGAVVQPAWLVGDLTLRDSRTRLYSELLHAIRAVARAVGLEPALQSETLLALDWGGSGPEAMLVGRHHACDVVLDDPTVSRRHAQLHFREGRWILCDLDSTNGTTLNGRSVRRCRLVPGDRLALGSARLLVD